jgi:hypothetical protein
MLLPEDNILLGTIERPPATYAGAEFGMPTSDLVENGNRAQARDTLKQLH